MKRLLKCGSLLLTIATLFTLSYGVQSGPRIKPKPSTQPGGPPVKPRQPRKKPTAPRPKRTRTPPAAAVPKVPDAKLTIKTEPPNCTILLDGVNKGQTKPDGSMVLTALPPKEYVVVARAAGHYDERRVVKVMAGQDIPPLKMTLKAMPGTLTVMSDAGADININQVGRYVGQVVDLKVPAGDYRVEVSKPGYQKETRIVRVPPEKPPAEQAIPLKPLPTEEALAQAEQYLLSKDYDTVIAICKIILTTQPNNRRANALTGYSHYYAARFEQGLPYLFKALDEQEQIEIPIKLYQKLPSAENLFSGWLMLQRGKLGFRSTENSSLNSTVTANKIYDLELEIQKGGRIYLLTGVNQGAEKKEKKEKSYYHPAAATLSGATKRTVECKNCQQELQAIFQLMQKITK